MQTKNLLIIVLSILVVSLVLSNNTFNDKQKDSKQRDCLASNKTDNLAFVENKNYHTIIGKIKKGETLFDIFKKNNLEITELFELKQASDGIHKLKNVYPGRPYKAIIDDKSQICAFTYGIDDDNILNIIRTEAGFSASKETIEYEKKILYIRGIIQNNLIESMGDEKNNFLLALQLSDIFAWDIDFTTDLRKGDIFKIIVESCFLNNEFKKYRKILAAEFINNGQPYHAFRFKHNGEVDYYDNEGKSLRRTFLKAPLSFSRISSYYSKRRLHPILKRYRSHLGIDYAAPSGTPVSAVGDGTIQFAGYKGQNGKLVIIRHPNSFRTYYLHLSKIKRGIRKGTRVKQGQIIGYVGSTGLSTGPHLDYRIKKHNRFVNPLALKLPPVASLPESAMPDFIIARDDMNVQLTSISLTSLKLAGKKKNKSKM